MFLINPFLSPAGGDFESIATVTVGSGGASSVEFSDIPGTYQHLQLRAIMRNTAGASGQYAQFRVNNDSGSNYAAHRLSGNGSTASSGAWTSQTWGIGFPETGSSSNSNLAVFVMDILDYASTSRNKTLRTFAGADNNGSGSADIWSHLWMSTSAITRLTFYAYSQGSASNFGQYTQFALYGVKAP